MEENEKTKILSDQRENVAAEGGRGMIPEHETFLLERDKGKNNLILF